jgi:hypothetical protein
MGVSGKHVNIGHHGMHYLCALAAVAVIAAIVLDAPVLALLGGLFCAAMMAGMGWMMIGMAAKRRR